MSNKKMDGMILSESDSSRQRIGRFTWIWLGLTIFLTCFAFWSAPKIPFHPDESTYLFMSRDFDLLWTSPSALIWAPAKAGDLRAHYRLIDAPLIRYVLGIGRSIAGIPALQADWDWTATWDKNQASGALPDPKLLNTGRITMTLLLPFDMLLLFLIGKRLQSPAAGLLAAALFGFNALLLLHGRRAMAEGLLMFGVLFCIWSFLTGSQKPWLVGLAIAFAVNAKQTCVVLIPVGLIAISLPETHHEEPRRNLSWRQLILKWAQFGAVILLLTLALNPYLWKYPLQAAQAAWYERVDLLNRQLADYAQSSAGLFSGGLTNRAGVLIAHTFMTPPVIAETSNYTTQIEPSAAAYFKIPGHNLLRGMLAGSVMLTMSLAGIVINLLGLRKSVPDKRRAFVLLMFTTLALGAAVFSQMVLPWQRYITALVPIACLWIALFLDLTFHLVIRQRQQVSAMV